LNPSNVQPALARCQKQQTPVEEPETEQKPQKRTSFLAELKHRKVFRVAATYAVVSWLIIQVASATFSDFGIPAWAFRFVVLMVLLGFPVAVILAWAFELTPEGVKKSANVEREQSVADEPGLNRRRNWLAIGMAAALPTLIFGTLSIFFYLGKSSSAPVATTASAVSDERPYVIGSLAVLPFTIISEETGIRVMAEGLHDEILTVFSGMDPLDVISRTSTLRYGNFTASIPEIGEALNADFIVEASVQTMGKKLRLTLQLIEAATDNHIWAQSFDRDPTEAADTIQFNKEMAFELAIRVYQSLEKTYPPRGATVELRDAKLAELSQDLDERYTRFWDFNAPDSAEQSRAIKAVIAEILRLDPDNPDASDKMSAMAYSDGIFGLRDQYDRDWQKEFHLILKRAYAVNPDGFDVNKHMGIYYVHHANQPNRAIPYCRKAIKLEKETRELVDVYTYYALLESLYATGQHGAALEVVEQAKDEGLTVFSGVTWFWSQAYTLNGRYEEALAFIDEKIAEAGSGSVDLQDKPENIIYNYEFMKARVKALWSGDRNPFDVFFAENQNNEAMEDIMRAYYAYFSGDDAKALELMSGLQQQQQVSRSGELSEMRGWIYLNSGNEALARSYFRGFLKEMSESTEARWTAQFMPDWYAAQRSYAHACLGERDEALAWAEKSIEQTDPSRNFEDYFESMLRLAISFSLIGETDRACEFIDQILSSPSGYTTGGMLLEIGLKPLHDEPAFQAVIRKHADQLKDPAILQQYFGE
jgi:TolB-like protein